MEVIKKDIDRIENGHSLVIFPEGTRSEGKTIKDFKPGSLKLATKTKANIVPLTIINSEACYELQHKFKPAKVKLIVGEEINLEQKGLKTTVEIANYLQNTIEAKYMSEAK